MTRLSSVLLAVTLGMAARPPAVALAADVAMSEFTATDTMTVEAVVEAARHRAPAIAAAELDRQAAVIESSAVARNRRPELAFVARALVAPKGFYDPALTNLGEYEAKVVLDLALADGGMRARARARSALDLAAARSQAALQSRDAGLQAADLAITLLKLREVELTQEQAVDWIDRLALLMRGAVRAGARSTTDSVRIALERNAAYAALEKTLFEKRTAEIDLLSLMGREADSTVVIVRPESPDRPPTADDSTLIMSSLERQPEVLAARIAEGRARIDVIEAKRATAPTLDLSLDAGLAGADLTRVVPEDLAAADPNATFSDRLRRDLGASATINLRAPISSAAARLTARSRTTTLRAAGIRSDAETLNQRKIALLLLARWESAYRRLGVARTGSVGAEQNLLRAKSLYSGGAIQLLDLLDARRVYGDARALLAEARQESRTAQFHAEDRR